MIAPQQPQLFGLLIPGRPVRTDFIPVDEAGTKFTLIITDENPLTISDIVFFLLPGIVLPPGTGAVVYWMVEGSGFETLGAITPVRPSGVFSTAWANNDAILSAVNQSASSSMGEMQTFVSITIGVSIEELSNIQNLGIVTKGVEDRVLTAKHIAVDLFNYLKSFDLPSFPDGSFAVPGNIFDRWMKRFEMKSRMDPNFFMRASS